MTNKRITWVVLSYLFLIIVSFLSFSVANQTTSISQWDHDSRVGWAVFVLFLSIVYVAGILEATSKNNYKY